MPGHVFVAYSAQADRLFYVLWRAGGAPLHGLFSALAFGLALLPFAMLAGRLRVRPLVLAITLLLAGFAMLPFRGLLPHVLAFALSGLIVYLLERPFGLWRALLVGALLGLWANLHGTFLVG